MDDQTRVLIAVTISVAAVIGMLVLAVQGGKRRPQPILLARSFSPEPFPPGHLGRQRLPNWGVIFSLGHGLTWRYTLDNLHKHPSSNNLMFFADVSACGSLSHDSIER